MVEMITNPQRRARQALSSFSVDMRRDNPYPDVNWDEVTWVVGTARRASARKVERLHFTRHAGLDAESNGLGQEFSEPFASFVRSVLVWRAINASKRPSALAQMVLVRAFRYLYEELARSESLLGNEVSPTKLKQSHFNAATIAVSGRETDQSAYRVANYLNYIAELIDRKALTSSPLRWKHSIPRPETSGGLRQDRIGHAYQERREKLLPKDEVLYSIADISNRDDLQLPDAIRQRLTDLLFCGGFRINEVLVLKRDALVEETVFDDLGQPVLDASGLPVPPHVGIRYVPEKGGGQVTGIKWIPSDLAPVAKRAISELRELTAEFSEDARFAHENPGRVRFGSPWDELAPETLLSMQQVTSMLGRSSRVSANILSETYGIPSVNRGRKSFCIKGDVERAIRERMGSCEVAIGDSKVQLHELLTLVPINFFHATKTSIPGSAVLVVDQNISDYLCGRSWSGGARVRSVFDRFGCVTSTGAPVKIRTHQFRHFLDSAAASGGLSELVRARWMGRKDVSQNSAYDHESGYSLAKKIRIRLAEGGVLGPIADAVQRHSDPAMREAAAEDLVRAAHKSLLGRCFHDWASSTCPENEACWGCGEHLIVKGELADVEEAERQLEETLQAIEIAGRERLEGTYGANNWLEAHERKCYWLKRILAVHRDPNIADGTIVHLRSEP